MRPIVAEGKQWVVVSLSRFIIGCLLKLWSKSAYLQIHHSRTFDITRTRSFPEKSELMVMKRGMNSS